MPAVKGGVQNQKMPETAEIMRVVSTASGGRDQEKCLEPASLYSVACKITQLSLYIYLVD
jgi:hypothetical protein